MKSSSLAVLLLISSPLCAWAGDDAVTPVTNKAAIDMVQSHANYLWTLVAAALVVFSVLFFDRIKVDDPVGAISVHGVCGAWGTLAAGIFNIGGTSAGIIAVQLTGIVSCFVWTFCTAFVMFKIISMTIGLRVSPDEEAEGLDFSEHGGSAYADFPTSAYLQQ